MRLSLTRLLVSSLTAGLLLVCTLNPHPARAIAVAALDSGTDIAVGDKMNFAGTGTGEVSNTGHGNTITRILLQYVPPEQIGMYTVVDANFNFNTVASEAALAFASAIPEVTVIDLSDPNPVSPEILQLAVDSGKLLVVNSGNNGLPHPGGIGSLANAFDGAMIVVGAIDPNGSVASYNNGAGDTAAYYVLAPGSTPFSDLEGTSFAKVHVSGTAALLFALFPGIKPRQVSAIIFETAIPIGGNTGHGVLDTAAALMPIEPVEVPTESSGGGGGAAIGAFAAIAIGAALLKKPEVKDTLVLDKYDRAYTIDLSRAIKTRDYRGTVGGILKSLGALDTTFSYDGSADATTLVRIIKPVDAGARGHDPARWTGDDLTLRPEPGLSLIHTTTDGKGFRFHVNHGATAGFGALGLASRADHPIEFLSNSAFSTPFLGFSTRGFASQMIYPLGDRTRFSMGLATVNEDIRHGLDSEAAVFEISRSGERFGSSVYFGRLSEQGSLFGGSNGGVFGVDENNTYSLGVSASYRISQDAHLLGNYTHGFSEVAETANSLLDNFSAIESNSWGLGLVFDNTLRAGDRVGLAVSQPLRVTDGSADLTVPRSIDLNDVVTRSTQRISLAPPGRETTFEAFYRMPVGRNGRFTTFLMHKQQPEHDIDAAPDTSILGIFQYRF